MSSVMRLVNAHWRRAIGTNQRTACSDEATNQAEAIMLTRAVAKNTEVNRRLRLGSKARRGSGTYIIPASTDQAANSLTSLMRSKNRRTDDPQPAPSTR